MIAYRPGGRMAPTYETGLVNVSQMWLIGPVTRTGSSLLTQ